MKFVHIADVHLDYYQYGSVIRHQDFADAWLWSCKTISSLDLDFVLLAGDLFHNRRISPEALSQAIAGLELINAPVYTIAGNHEIPKVDDEVSWLEFLDDRGYLVKLDKPIIERDYRIYGFDWLGSATNRILSNFTIPDSDKYTILMMHAGYEHMPTGNFPGSIKYENIKHLPIDYLALGHIHQPYDDNLVRTPGSTENVSIVECRYNRGFFVVEDGNIETIETPKRICVRLEIEEMNQIVDVPSGAILDISIVGREHLSPTDVKKYVDNRFDPLVTIVKDKTVDIAPITYEEDEVIIIEEDAIKAVTDHPVDIIMNLIELSADGAGVDTICEYLDWN